MENNEMMKQNTNTPAEYDPNAAYGFEETDNSDLVIPRIKVINALSPERQDGVAEEGDVINALTQESVKGKRFVPVKQYYTNIMWNPDRSAEQRMLCRSFDGKIGQCDDGSVMCSKCCKNKFDNTKTGKDAQPKCTSYLNFLGFFEDCPMPVILSFARTNYNEGRKLLSIAKSMRSAIWSYAYTLDSKLITKDRNKWYNLVPTMDSPTDEATRKLAFELFNSVQVSQINTDYEDTGSYNADSGKIDEQVATEI